MNDRYRNSEFYWGKKNELEYIPIQQFDNPKLNSENVNIRSLSFMWDVDGKKKRELTINEWKKVIPTLEKIKRLKIYAGIDQCILEIFCEVPNVEHLHILSSKATDLNSLYKFKNLKRLELDSFTRLEDISPLKNLQLTHLRIENSFKIGNYEVIGEIKTLIGVSLKGYDIGPRNLKLISLEPFENLKSLKHLDLSFTSIGEKESFKSILNLKSLRRFDFLGRIPKQIREEILKNHKTLDSGFVTDWDYEKQDFKENKNWEME